MKQLKIHYSPALRIGNPQTVCNLTYIGDNAKLSSARDAVTCKKCLAAISKGA